MQLSQHNEAMIRSQLRMLGTVPEGEMVTQLKIMAPPGTPAFSLHTLLRQLEENGHIHRVTGEGGRVYLRAR